MGKWVTHNASCYVRLDAPKFSHLVIETLGSITYHVRVDEDCS